MYGEKRDQPFFAVNQLFTGNPVYLPAVIASSRIHGRSDMNTAPAHQGNGETSHLIDALVAADGTAIHSHPLALLSTGAVHATRSLHNLADTVHYLCLLHGRYPGVIDHAATRSTENVARKWLIQAADAFVAERAFLTRLAVALGPAPSTAGQNTSDATILQQRHALDMLAQSDRRGCAMGAALALAIDWLAVRRLLDSAALRVGIEPPASKLPTKAATLEVAAGIAIDNTVSRAVQFGARQLLSQHRGLWDLLKSRAEIRDAN